jgi:hypothetical protein
MSPPAGGPGEIVVSACGRTHRGRVRADNQDRFLFADLADQPADAHVADDAGRGSAVGPLRFTLTESEAALPM